MHNFIRQGLAASRRRYVHDPAQRGQGLVEYALILVLVAVVVIVVAAVLGEQVQDVYCDVVLSLGSGAPTVPACEAPRVTCAGVGNGEHVSGSINMEAVIRDNKGVSSENIPQVRFYIDGTLRHTEYIERYCLGGGGDGGVNCNLFSTSSLSSGEHTIRAETTDADGYTGECSITIHKP